MRGVRTRATVSGLHRIARRWLNDGGISSADVLARGPWRGLPWEGLLSALQTSSFHPYKGCPRPRPRTVVGGDEWRSSLTSIMTEENEFSMPTIVVSACLLHHPVTYRGGASFAAMADDDVQKQQHFVDPLSVLVRVIAGEWGAVRCVPLCPEMQLLGLLSPREPIRLTTTAPPGGDDVPDTRVVRSRDHRSLLTYNPATDTLKAVEGCSGDGCGRTLRQHLHAIDGFLLKSKSPSCGVKDVKLYHLAGGDDDLGRDDVIGTSKGHDGCFTELLRNSLASPSPAPPIMTEAELRRRTFTRDDDRYRRELPLVWFLTEVLHHFMARQLRGTQTIKHTQPRPLPLREDRHQHQCLNTSSLHL